MIFFSVGLQSRFGEWCDAVAVHLVEQALGPVAVIYADTLEQFVTPVVKTRSPYVVVSSRQTVGGLWAALGESDRGFVVALDDPRVAIENLVSRHGHDFVEAVRVVAKSCASMVSCVPLPGALVLRAGDSEANPVATAEAIARHFGLDGSKADVPGIVATLADSGKWPWRSEGDFWWDGLEEAQRLLVIGAIEPFAAHLAGGDLGSITWERELFYISEERPEGQHQPASRPVDITGRPRYLVYGPHITLPPGSWSATVALGFSEEAAEMSYLVEVHSATLLAQLRIQPGQQRFIEANLNFSIAEPNMIDVRVLNERAAFDGRLALGHVIVTSSVSMRPETRNYFATTLP